jgi:hypothetical protein
MSDSLTLAVWRLVATAGRTVRVAVRSRVAVLTMPPAATSSAAAGRPAV